MNEKWFALDVKQIERKLKTNAASGLTRKAARSRGIKNSGHLLYVPRRAPWRLVLDIFSDFSLIILLLGAVFSLFFEAEERIRGIVVLVLALCNLGFCLIVYFRSRRMMESLTSFFYPTARVIRNGRLHHMDFRYVVVGDVLLLEKGDVLCCDVRLVTSESLKVKMRLDKERFVDLDKDAEAVVSAAENRASRMDNMVHGGSVIESGSARAIVTAVGKYTYLGAMTGGIPLPYSDRSSDLLKKIKKHFSKINFAMLIAVIPFSVISLLFGNLIVGRDSFLSAAFLTALAIASTAMSQLICTMFEIFYTNKVRKLVTGTDPIVFKSIDSFDKIKNTDYIFLLDGCALTDGRMHFASAASSEGEIRNFNSLNRTAVSFAEYVHLYHIAATTSLTTGISGSGDYLDGVGEFVEKSCVDANALKIRCTVMSYTPGNMHDVPETISFLDQGIRFELSVSRTISPLYKCKSAMFGGEWCNLSAEGIRNFERMWKRYESEGMIPLLFTVSSEHNSYSSTCFLGIVALKDGVDENLDRNLSRLKTLGCNVISFVGSDNAPKIPSSLTRNCVSKAMFVQSRLPITYKFGTINAYSGLNESDIIDLISFAHSHGKSVTVVGFTQSALKIAERADNFVSCSSVSPRISGYLDEEIYTAEVVGQRGSSNCSYAMKEKCNCILPRPKKGRGGLASLVSAICDIRTVYNNISDCIRYLIATQIISIVIVGIPMLFGDAVLDAQHVILGAFTFGMISLFAFIMRKNLAFVKPRKNYCDAKRIKDYFVGDKAIIISGIASSLCAVSLPWIINLFDGKYDIYKTEVLFTSYILLYVTAFVAVYYGNNFNKIKNIYRNIFVIVEMVFAIIFLLACFLWNGLGFLFGIVNVMPLQYFMIAILPVIVYVLLFTLFNRKTDEVE